MNTTSAAFARSLVVLIFPIKPSHKSLSFDTYPEISPDFSDLFQKNRRFMATEVNKTKQPLHLHRQSTRNQLKINPINILQELQQKAE
ncbi:MAG: hypothetical protein ACKO85_03245, partial [Isosphaeraceae bacterium]